MKKTRFFLFLSLAVVGLLMSSCYDDDVYYSTSDYDLTITNYDTTFDFQTYKTYFLRDSVDLKSDYIKEDDPNWNIFYSNNGPSDQIIAKVRSHFDELGYTEIDSAENADFAVNMVALLMREAGYVYYPGYWWGWWGYYPWYGYGYVYTYETGTLVLDMVDGNSLRDFIEYMDGAENPYPGDPNSPDLRYVWSAAVDGIQSDGNDLDRVLDGIDEAFLNSPYLELN